MKKRHAIGLMIFALSAPIVVTGAQALNVKLGLWEISSATRMSGVPPLPSDLLATMTPDQRAVLEAAFKAQSQGDPITDTSRECITQEDLEQPFAADDLENCTQTVVTSTATTQEFRLSCEGERQGTGLFRIHTPTPETMTGEFELQVGEGGQAMTIRSQLEGRWLSADCGDEE